MDYKATPQSGKSYVHMWDVNSTVCFDGGFLVDKSTLPVGLEVLPKGTFMKVDLEERTASVIKTATLFEALTALATTVKVKKGALLIAADVIGTEAKHSVAGVINVANAEFDSFDIEANALGVLPIGETIQLSTADGLAINPDGVTFCNVDIDAEPSCSVIFRADGVIPEALPQAPTDAMISALKFFQFLKK